MRPATRLWTPCLREHVSLCVCVSRYPGNGEDFHSLHSCKNAQLKRESLVGVTRSLSARFFDSLRRHFAKLSDTGGDSEAGEESAEAGNRQVLSLTEVDSFLNLCKRAETVMASNAEVKALCAETMRWASAARQADCLKSWTAVAKSLEEHALQSPNTEPATTLVSDLLNAWFTAKQYIDAEPLVKESAKGLKPCLHGVLLFYIEHNRKTNSHTEMGKDELFACSYELSVAWCSQTPTRFNHLHATLPCVTCAQTFTTTFCHASYTIFVRFFEATQDADEFDTSLLQATRHFLAVKATLCTACEKEPSELIKNKIAVDLLAKFDKLTAVVKEFDDTHNVKNPEVEKWSTAIAKNMKTYGDEIAKLKVRCMESLTNGLREEQEKLGKVHLGADDGKSWKAELAADAPWQAITKAAGKLLTSDKFATELSTCFKRMMEVSARANTPCPTPLLCVCLCVCACVTGVLYIIPCKK
eukprot:6491403-Amphidinium_carterae.1